MTPTTISISMTPTKPRALSHQLCFRVTPRSGRDEVVGYGVDSDGAPEVRVRVTAPPDKGRANKAVCELVAKQLRIGKTCVSVISGETSRNKRLEIQVDSAVLDDWLKGLRALEAR